MKQANFYITDFSIICPPLALVLNEQKCFIGKKNFVNKFLQVTFTTNFQPKTLAKRAASKQYNSIKQRSLLDKNASPLSPSFHSQTLLPLHNDA